MLLWFNLNSQPHQIKLYFVRAGNEKIDLFIYNVKYGYVIRYIVYVFAGTRNTQITHAVY